ncbi:formyl-CoA transferase [Acrocarpospora pleiomorpha]|uniref:Formyl-CoA transferase n=1 Tax=Acrocarpospora pleiomorpha TaxID=90975 RepID=A0A5M3XHI5_9ACTN|nr:CoA transferase [Acrocarpospora pleiomorpha]GES20694.1 formyl-CoA transferase [Acrocarpospora pleiomorpha]
MSGPLADVRVIDFCWVGAGSFATKILADHGADVIKIESRAKVDGLRLSPPFAGGEPGINRSGYFADRNSSKRSMALNLRHAAGREIAARLCADADVIANNFTPGVMERFGLGPARIAAINPRAVYLSMSTHGSTGPYRDHIGYGSTIAALAGLHGLIGERAEPPTGTGTNYADHIPNPTHAAFAVLAALRHRELTGEGQFIDLAQVEPTVAMIGAAVLEATALGIDPVRSGNSHPAHAPHGVYRCVGDDAWVAIAVTSDDQWESLCRVLDLDRVPEWSRSEARLAAADAVDRAVSQAVATIDTLAVVSDLRAAGVPAAAVADAAAVLADEQLNARGHWQYLDHPEMGRTVYASPPFRLSATPGALRGPAPMLGEHTDEICRDLLGLTGEEIQRLTAEQVLW